MIDFDELDEVEVITLPSEAEIKADLSDRRTFIGGSDAPVIIGLSSWKSPFQLYLEKTGQAPEADLSEIERVQWGIKLEDLVAREFMARTGMKVRRVNQRQRHKEKPYLVAQIDRRIVGGGILECKTTDASRKQDWEDGVPDHYLVQVQHQLLVTGEDFAYIAVLIGGNTFKYFKIDRDETMINNLQVILDDFWNKVQTRTPPEPMSTKEARQIWTKGEGVVIGGDEEKAIIMELLEIKKTIKELEEKQEKLELALQSKIRDIGDTLTIEGIPIVSWKVQLNTKLDTKALEESLPEVVAKFKKTTESRFFRILKGAEKIGGMV